MKLPADFDASLISLDVQKGLAEWQELGVRRIDGTDLPMADLSASLVSPGDDNTDVFIVYDNYRTTLKWNRSTYSHWRLDTLLTALVSSRLQPIPDSRLSVFA